MKTRLFVIALAATASLAACGAEEKPSKASSTGPSQEAQNRKVLLDYARCMREHGVDMPDPKFDGGRVMQKMGKTSPEALRSAEQACAKIRAQIKAPELSDDDKQEFKRAALANAHCMREHGIDNFPDPVFDADGGAQIRIRRALNPESAKFQAAQKACEKFMKGPSQSSAGEDEK